MADYLERLELPKSAVEARIRFLVDRANAHRGRANETERKESWRRIAGFGAAGSYYSEAASLSMLLGHSADDLLYQAARSYLLAEHPYGMFLMSLSTRPDEAQGFIFNSPASDWLSRLDRASSETGPHEGERDDEEIPSQLMSINQQLYLCFAMISMPVVGREYRGLLKRMISEMGSHSNLPHGPQGQPLQTQIDILEPALNMIAGEQRPRDVNRAMQAITRLSLHYAEAIEAARRNSYLWRNMWSPVEYLDLEIVGAVMCMGRASSDLKFRELPGRDIDAGIPVLVAEDRLRPFSGVA
jgi:hypothetical protein